MFIFNFSFGQKVLVLDSQSKEVLPFAAYYSSNGSCSGYSDLRGLINYCTDIDTLKITYLGYKTGMIFNFSKNRNDTIYLDRRSFYLDSIFIKSRRINVFKELNTILTGIKKNNYTEEVNSLFYLESLESGEMIERIEMISNDNLGNKKIKQNARICGSYLIDKKSPYYSIDLDNFFKNIPFFSKKSRNFKHIFLNKKIKRKYFNIFLIRTNKDHTREVLYTKKHSNKIKGFIKYNYKTHEIIEHRFKIKDFSADFSSLNKDVNTSIDSIQILYHFNHNRFTRLTYKIWIYKKGDKYPDRSIVSRGFIKILDKMLFKPKIEIPEYKYESLQEEIIFSPNFNNIFLRLDSISTVDSLFYKKKSPADFLSSDDTLTIELLNKLNLIMNRRKIWSLNKKLTQKDFISNKAVANLGMRGRMTFLSDLHNIKIHWIIVPYIDKGKIKYISPNSIWNSKESMVLYYNVKQCEWVANATFDIFELYRRKLIYKLNKSTVKYPQIEIRKFYSDASHAVQIMLNKTNYGLRHRKKINKSIKQQFNQFGILLNAK